MSATCSKPSRYRPRWRARSTVSTPSTSRASRRASRSPTRGWEGRGISWSAFQPVSTPAFCCQLFYRDAEDGSRHSSGVKRALLSVPDDAPERRGFSPQLAECPVPLDVVGQDHTSGPQTGPDRVELAPHVAVCVLAVVQKEVRGAHLFEESWQDPLA